MFCLLCVVDNLGSLKQLLQLETVLLVCMPAMLAKQGIVLVMSICVSVSVSACVCKKTSGQKLI